MKVTNEMVQRGLTAWIKELDPDLRGGTIEHVAERGIWIALKAALEGEPACEHEGATLCVSTCSCGVVVEGVHPTRATSPVMR